MNRRDFLRTAATSTATLSAAAGMARAATPGIAEGAATAAAASSLQHLKSLTTAAKPISVEERRQRIVKLQAAVIEQEWGALVVESGSTLEYFTGIRWHRSERTTAAIIPARGELIIVTPAFEEPSVRETLQVRGEVRPWDEADSPFERLVQGLRDRGVASGTVAVESTIRFFIVDGMRRASGAYAIVSGDPVVGACRLIKSPAELELMRIASAVTIEALRQVHAHVERGMDPGAIRSLMDKATVALGGAPEFALVLLNESSAYPHGSHRAETVREGGVILMDCGCTVHGYQSDISRTWVHGTPNARQRKVWETVRRGQEIALETARIGLPAGRIDDAVRSYYEREGWGPGYRLPGLSHRTGHGIGLDGHESAYLVHGDGSPLQAGMCFSDEPGIYIPGEFGIRLEDCWHMSGSGPQLFTALAKSIEEPM